MGKAALREVVIKLTLFLGSLVLVMFALEIFLRISLKEDYSVPSHRNWLFRKNWEEKFAHLNSLGHRDHEFSVEKPDGTFRILVIGDSFTYGEGIKNLDDLYTEVLEKKLNSGGHGIRYEVLNVAHKGWNVEAYLSFLTNQGLFYQPDLVVIGFFLNDIEVDQSKRPKNVIIPESLHWILSRFSYLYWHTYSRYDGWKNKDTYIDYHLSFSSTDSYDWQRFVLLWKEIFEVCRMNNIKSAVIILPHLTALDDRHPFISVYKNVAEVSESNGAVVLNLFPAVKGHHPPDLWIGLTDSHPNELAHRIFADEIYEFLKEEKLVTEFQ